MATNRYVGGLSFGRKMRRPFHSRSDRVWSSVVVGGHSTTPGEHYQQQPHYEDICWSVSGGVNGGSNNNSIVQAVDDVMVLLLLLNVGEGKRRKENYIMVVRSWSTNAVKFCGGPSSNATAI